LIPNKFFLRICSRIGCFVPTPFKQFLEVVTNMVFDEDPNYVKLISLFKSLIEPCTMLRLIRIDEALKVAMVFLV